MLTSLHGEAALKEHMWTLAYAGAAIGAGSYVLVPETTVASKTVRFAGIIGGAYLILSSLRNHEEELVEENKVVEDIGNVIVGIKLPSATNHSPPNCQGLVMPGFVFFFWVAC